MVSFRFAAVPVPNQRVRCNGVSDVIIEGLIRAKGIVTLFSNVTVEDIVTSKQMC